MEAASDEAQSAQYQTFGPAGPCTKADCGGICIGWKYSKCKSVDVQKFKHPQARSHEQLKNWPGVSMTFEGGAHREVDRICI